MAVYNWPTFAKIVSATIDIQRNQIGMEGVSGYEQILIRPGDKWVMSVKLARMSAEQARGFIGFYQSLRGRLNHFRMKHPDYQGIAGTANGQTGAVKGGSQTGQKITLDGFSEGRTFQAGDILQFGGDTGSPKLKTNLFDARVSDGEVTLSIDPPVYSAFANNTVVKTQNQMGTFRLSSPSQPIETDNLRLHTFSLAIEEVLP